MLTEKMAALGLIKNKKLNLFYLGQTFHGGATGKQLIIICHCSDVIMELF